MSRRTYAWLQVAAALIAPILYAIRLTNFSFAQASLKGVIYWLAIPAVALLGGYLAMILPAGPVAMAIGFAFGAAWGERKKRSVQP